MCDRRCPRRLFRRSGILRGTSYTLLLLFLSDGTHRGSTSVTTLVLLFRTSTTSSPTGTIFGPLHSPSSGSWSRVTTLGTGPVGRMVDLPGSRRTPHICFSVSRRVSFVLCGDFRLLKDLTRLYVCPWRSKVSLWLTTTKEPLLLSYNSVKPDIHCLTNISSGLPWSLSPISGRRSRCSSGPLASSTRRTLSSVTPSTVWYSTGPNGPGSSMILSLRLPTRPFHLCSNSGFTSRWRPL